MPENPKAKSKKIKDFENVPSSQEPGESSYYYDDSHGYEDYDKEKDQENDDEDCED
jgi:hypothetical protein